MYFFFGDDSRQNSPTRQKMGPLVSAGGVLVPSEVLCAVEREIDQLCDGFGFPKNEEFKWSPGREKWMREHLVGTKRQEFFKELLRLAAQNGLQCIFVSCDTNYSTATQAKTHDEDVATLLLERIQLRLPNDANGCVVIVDRPSGNRGDEDRFLLTCLERIQLGTSYVKYDKIALNVLSTPSKLVRLLQLADVVTSCCTARVSGETVYSPAIFEHILPLFPDESGRAGGISFKIHPDYKYINLYHWLLKDPYFLRFGAGQPLPMPSRPFRCDEISY